MLHSQTLESQRGLKNHLSFLLLFLNKLMNLFSAIVWQVTHCYFSLHEHIHSCAHTPHHHNGFVVTHRLWPVAEFTHCQCQNQQSAQQSLGQQHKHINKNRNWFMTHRVLTMHKAKSIMLTQYRHGENAMHTSSSSPQWLCGDRPLWSACRLLVEHSVGSNTNNA